MNKAEREAVRKDVEFVAKDAEEQVATGIVMVPWKVDLQGDWERPETIQEFADQFADFEAVGQADGGVMHAVWPDDHIELEDQRVLDEAQDIGGMEAPEGAWVQEWHFADDELWSLVEDGILEGYSIGAVDVHWNGPMDQADLPEEVTVPDEIDEDQFVWELESGIVREVSAVDIPAVPDAMILETKDAYEKRLADHLGNRDGFIEEAIDRGHSQAEAERLWEYLNGAVDIEGAGDPGSKGLLHRAGEAALSVLAGADEDDPDLPHRANAAATPDEDPRPSAKEGRTLSQPNRDSLMASIDAGLDVLHDAGMDDIPKRFTDREDVDFDLSEHSAREWVGDHDDEEEDEESPFENAAGGDTPESGSTDAADTMTDENETSEPWEDAPEWAEDLRDNQEEHSKRIDDLESDDEPEESLADEPPEWAQSLQEDVEENSQRLAEALGEGDGDDPFEDAPEWAKSLKEDIDANADRIDTISQQSGRSTQLDAAAGADNQENGSQLDELGKALGGGGR